MISISPTVIISLGTSVFVVTVLFFYFRNKMKNLEFKLNTMFQLIQEHVSKQKNEEVSLIDVSDGGESSAESVTTDESEVDLREASCDIREASCDIREANVDIVEDVILLSEDNHKETVDVETVASDEVQDLTKFSVASLRQMAEDKNLERYKSLRKNDLIELLKGGE